MARAGVLWLAVVVLLGCTRGRAGGVTWSDGDSDSWVRKGRFQFPARRGGYKGVLGLADTSGAGPDAPPFTASARGGRPRPLAVDHPHLRAADRNSPGSAARPAWYGGWAYRGRCGSPPCLTVDPAAASATGVVEVAAEQHRATTEHGQDGLATARSARRGNRLIPGDHYCRR